MTDDTGIIVDSYRALVDEVDEGFCVIEVLEGGNGDPVDYRFLEANASFERQTGLINAVGCRMRDLEPQHEQHWFDRYSRIARTRTPERFEDRAEALGRWYDVYAFPIGRPEQHRVAILFRDVIDRKRAEEALRESEERFQQFAKASSAALWIRDADTLTMEYVSPAISAIYGVEPDAFLGDMKHWTAAILPEDHNTALEHIDRARRGEPVVHEFRIRRATDNALRRIRNTDFPLFDEEGQVQRIGGIAEDVTDAKRAVEHQGVLLAELQHRVRNILAMFRSTVRQTSRNKTGLEAFIGQLTGRIDAMARTQNVLTRHPGEKVDLEEILREELLAQTADAEHFALKGPTVLLAPKAAEALTLGFHELATNSVKYGVLGNGNGRLAVDWRRDRREGRDWVALRWIETGIRMPDAKSVAGFGTELITRRLPYELGGEASMEFAEEGLVVEIRFALADGSSVFQTDAGTFAGAKP